VTRGLLIAGAVGIVVAALLLGGVRLDELALVLVYQAAFVLGPGLWLVRPLKLESAALRYGAAWTLGSVTAATLFLVGGAIGLHAVVWALPAFALAAALQDLMHRWPPRQPSLPSVVGILVLCILGSALMWLSLFGPAPLIRSLGSGYHDQDLVFHLALAGEMLHHGFPFQDPSVAGEPLRYQVLPHLDAAAGSFVTGIDLEVLLWRTQPVLAVAAGAALAAGIARRYGVGIGGGLLAAALLLFGGELDLTALETDFGNRALLTGDLLSPTQLFAVPLLLTMLVALRASKMWSIPVLMLWVLLGFGGMAAKVTVVPVFVGGLAFAASLAARRSCVVRFAPTVGASLCGAAVAFALLYAGSEGHGLVLDPLAIVGGADQTEKLKRAAFLPFIALASAGGVLSYVVLRRPQRDDWLVWVPVGVLVTSLVPYLLLDHPGQSQVYFLRAGLAAAAPLSGAGVALALATLGVRERLALVAVTAVGAWFGTRAAANPAYIDRWALSLALVLLFGVLLARARVARTAVLAGTAVAVLSLADPFIDSGSRARTLLRGETLVHPDDPNQSRGITAGVRDALLWLRGHSDVNDVIIVNNANLVANGNPRYFYYAALAERRVFLQGWAYSDRAVPLSADQAKLQAVFSDRARLNNEALNGDRIAVRSLAQTYGARFIFIDLRYGRRPPARPWLKLVHKTEQAAVYEVGPQSP
jgi:hypothetical protein